MEKEEILNKCGIALENFCPAPGAAIKIIADVDKIDVEVIGYIVNYLEELYPEHNIFTTFKGMDVK